jgi:hypothetical protein
MTNVLLYNLFYDVPVKLFAAHLVLFALFVILADVVPLYRFFVLNKSAERRAYGYHQPRVSASSRQ